MQSIFYCIVFFILECYENELEQTKRQTINIGDDRDYINKLTSELNDIENKYSILSNDHQQYKTATEHTIFVLTNKLNASEEIVKQLIPGNFFYTSLMTNLIIMYLDTIKVAKVCFQKNSYLQCLKHSYKS